MPLGDLGKYTHGSKTWYDELARRIEQYRQQNQREIFTPSYYVETLCPQHHARLQTMAHQLRNRYQRIKLNEKRTVNNEQRTENN